MPPTSPGLSVRPFRGLGLYPWLLLLFAGAAFAQPAALFDEPESPWIDGPAYTVSQFVVLGGDESSGVVETATLLPLEVALSPSPTGYIAPREGVPVETVRIESTHAPDRTFHASAIGAISRQIVEELRSQGLLGVYVAPHPADIDPKNDSDLRRPGDTLVRLLVSSGRIQKIRTVATGERVTSGWRIDNEIHRNIRLNSPLQPASSGLADTTDVVRKDELEDYLFYLNRHRGRKVEAALAPSADGQGIDLDYRVNEAKPWFAYIDSSNTGTSQTAKWQHRIGFVDRQLTNRDDILAVEYMNAGLDKVHAVRGSYEAPWFGQRRPSWLKRSGREPGWLAWFDRDKVPWWGLDRLRWRVGGSWNQYKAEDVQGNNFKGTDWTANGAIIYNALQYRNLFLDVALILGGRGVETENETFDKTGEATLFLPGAAVTLQRSDEVSNLMVNAYFSASVLPIDAFDAANLGRFGTDRTWQLLRWDSLYTHYLEPLLYPAAWRNPATPASSTLAHEGALAFRGQYSFGNRLIPQVTQVVGGLYSVRGYPQSTAVGDDVYLGTAEYRLHIPRLLPINRQPLKLPWIGDFRIAPQQPYGQADWDLIVRGFVDAAYTNQYEPDNNVQIPGETDQFLLGAGIGIELQIKNYLRVRVDSAWALKDSKSPGTPVRKGHQEFYFLFTALY